MNQDSTMESELDNENKTAGRWTNDEHNLFLDGLRLHQKQWKNIADLVKTRTVVQIRTHAQKYFQKMEKSNFHNISAEATSTAELNSSEGDDFRRAGYRTNSISSTDSFDSNHGKFGRSVSIGSDGGCTDSDMNQFKPGRSGSVSSVSSFSGNSFQSELLMLNLGTNPQRLDGKQNLRPRAVSMNDSHSGNMTVKGGNGVHKKRSRDKTPTAAATSLVGPVSAQPFTPSEPVRAPKSPKRAYTKQPVSNSVKIESREMSVGSVDVLSAPRGDYFHFPPQHSQAVTYAQAQSLPSQSYFDSLRECGFRSHVAGECEDELLSMLERIDWSAASPCPSPLPAGSAALSSSSPFTDSAISLSSSCENMPLFYSAFVPPLRCASYSPCTVQSSAQRHSPNLCTSYPSVSAPSEQDELDVFDEFYKDMDLLEEEGRGACGELSQVPLDAAIAATTTETHKADEAFKRTILHQNTINNANISCSIIPFAAVSADKHPHQHEPMHRVTFASVIDELKAKASHLGGGSMCGDAYFPISQSFLRPVRPRAESTRLPSLSTLTSGAPPAVVMRSTSSLTLMDPTFCNYPLMYGDSPPDSRDHQDEQQQHIHPHQQQQQGSSFGFSGQYLNENGGMSAVSLDSVQQQQQQDEASRHYNFGLSYHATPPSMSPAAKKRGRPRKFPLVPVKGADVATVTPTIASSRSLNNLSSTSGGSGRGGMVKISSHPNFPGSMSLMMGTQHHQYQQQGKHSFDDFLWDGSSGAGGMTARSESIFAIESSSGALPFPADVGSYSPKPPSSSSSNQLHQQQDAEALYCDPFQYDGGGDFCSDLLLDAVDMDGSFGFDGVVSGAAQDYDEQQQHPSNAPPCGDLGDEMMCFDMLESAFE